MYLKRNLGGETLSPERGHSAITAEQPQQYKITGKWVEVENSPIQFTNQMLVQHIGNEFVLTFGYMTPPAFLSPPSQEDLEAIDYSIPINPIVRLGMTPDRMLELIKTLQENYRNYQAGVAASQGLDN